MKKSHRSIPYHHRIALALLVFTLVPCLLLEIIYLKNVRSTWKQTALSECYNTADTNALLLSRKIMELQSKQQYILNNTSVRSAIAQINQYTLVQQLDMIITLEDAAASITADNPDLNIRWYPYLCTYTYGSCCYPLTQLQEEFYETFSSSADQVFSENQDDLYETILSLEEGEQFWMIRDISRQPGSHGTLSQYLCLYTQMKNLNGSDCILEFCIPLIQILPTDYFESIPSSLFIIHLGQGKEPLYLTLNNDFSSTHTNSQTVQYSQMLSDAYITSKGLSETYEIIHTQLPNIGNSEIFYLIPDSYVSEQVYPQTAAFLAVSLLGILLVISTSYLTSHLLTRKIVNMMNTINNNLDFILRKPEETNLYTDDIGQLSERVNALIRNTREYYTRLQHYETQNLRMELLQMRFNPHLLYNTLGAIRHQAPPTVHRTIDSLCRYYRIVLNNGYQIIRIKDEIDMIKDYLSIEKFAYMLDNIRFEFEIEEQALQYTIIKHVLQPIVENALHHGIRTSGRDGLLKIKVFSEADNICIQISDNGIGMTTEETIQLLNAPKQNISQGGYGIYNVQQRIQLYYGKEYGLQIESIPDQGTIVSLRIPKIDC